MAELIPTTPDHYTKWIDDDIKAHNGLVRGRCQGTSERMVEAFPELRQVRGYVQLADGWAPPHWWCETADGTVVDPTAAQFGNIVGYDEYSEAKHGPLPTGKCMNCGSMVYDSEHQGLCSIECCTEFEAYMREERARHEGKTMPNHDLQRSDFEYRDNPISKAADEIRYAASHFPIEDAFFAVKRVYDEMRGAVSDGGEIHDDEETDDAAA